jgi:hypothetical protein
MAVTLAQLRKSAQNKIAQGFISELMAHSELLNRMIFDDCVAPSGGSNLVYGYNRVITPSTAGFRALNSEYSPSEAVIDNFTTTLGILGGSFQIDRVTAQATRGALVDQLAMQLAEKQKAIIQGFNNAVINGDTGVDANGFDGLGKALVGSSTEYDGASLDLSTAAAMTTNAMAFADMMDEFRSLLADAPTFYLTGRKLKNKMNGIARRLGTYSNTKTDAGAVVDMYDGVPVLDLGQVGGTDIIPVATGLTKLYAVTLGLDQFHGVTLTGGGAIHVYTPDLQAPGAVKTGEAEMVCSVALKATKAAGVLKALKVA